MLALPPLFTLLLFSSNAAPTAVAGFASEAACKNAMTTVTRYWQPQPPVTMICLPMRTS